MYAMITELLSGLALFLFGMKFMSESLQKAAGEKLRGILNSVTKNKITAVLFGALFTAVIQSSGATTVMEVSFVNAGIMTLEKSVGITFGANIGTTITSQLVSLKLTAVAPFIIFIGAAIIMFGKKPILRKVAEVIFGFGALFLGINFMTGALGTLQEFPTIMGVFASLENPVIAVLVGFILTVIVQSSSVTVSVLVLLADSGLVGLAACIYFILGANIGSCTPAVMAAMNAQQRCQKNGTGTCIVQCCRHDRYFGYHDFCQGTGDRWYCGHQRRGQLQAFRSQCRYNFQDLPVYHPSAGIQSAAGACS